MTRNESRPNQGHGILPSAVMRPPAHSARLMVELKIRKFGKSLGVILPKEVINRLQTTEGAPIFLIEIEDGDYWLTSSDSAFEKKMGKAEEIIQRYRNTLHSLAR